MLILDGKTFVAMVMNGFRDIKSKYESINDLNVFPVPDGDTGTNMTSTLTGGVKSMEKANQESIGDVAGKLAQGMLLGARGNSGVILSQFFSGIANGLEGLETANLTQFAAALRSGTQKAYEAVVQPVEGTILTVARVGTEYIFEKLTTIPDFESLFEVLLKQMRKALQTTPDLLPVLKEAGVIDSGGAGLVAIIEGMGKEILGETVEDTVFNGPANSIATDGEIAFDADSVMTYGYCTEFILQLQNCKCNPAEFEVKDLIDFLSTIGDSIVAVKSDTVVKVHVHTLEPWKAIQFAQKYGEFITFKMENMSIQHNEVLLKEEMQQEESFEHTSVACVAVAPSEQIGELFKQMGVRGIITGGQTMNPSAQDFIEAFGKVNADNIIVFPNNSNVILTAEQAAEMYGDGAKIIVMKTKSPVECYSALSLANIEEDELDTTLETMKNSMAGLTSAEVCPAVRDSVNNGLEIKAGEFMGIAMHKVVASEKDMVTAAMKVLENVPNIDDKEVITVFTGEDATPEEIESFRSQVAAKYPLMEFVEIEGGQSIYPFILAVE